MNDSIIRFINGEISKYIIPDIQRLSALRPQGSEKTGSCAIPTAMLLFAVTDLFGYLIRNDCRNPKTEDTKGNFRELYSHPVSNFPTEYIERLDTLVYLFRHGLMHQVFPKMAGINKNGPDSPLFSFFNNLDHLNVDRLTVDVIEMISNFKVKLLQSENSGLCSQMSIRLNNMAKDDFQEMNFKRKAEQTHKL